MSSPQARKIKLQRRYQFAKASLAIEGLNFTPEEEHFFESMLRENLSFEEMKQALEERFAQFGHCMKR